VSALARQPLRGAVASVAVMALALAFVASFEFSRFAGQVSFFMLCLIPLQVVAVVLWGAKLPLVELLPRPLRGIALLFLNVAIAVAIAPIALQVAGEGLRPPGPIPSHFAIIVVPTTFWLAIMFGGWPFTAIARERLVPGLAVLAASYVITYGIFATFFNYGFLEGTPAYLASAPQGLFNGVIALVFYVTCLAVMFLVLCFDLWPFTTSPALMKQPVLGAVWTVVALAGGAAATYVGLTLMGADPMVFLTRVSAPFIFGSIIVLNMLQNSLFASMRQPLKGVMNAAAAAVIGVGLARLYGALAPAVSGQLTSGPPGYDFEVWLANALLSVTFPFLIFHAAYFDYWPLPAAHVAAENAARD
jgi:hypothetical protein